jgi:hypothetical protein
MKQLINTTKLRKALKRFWNIHFVRASYSHLNMFDLANMEIKVNEHGFSIWLIEHGNDGKLHRRWIIDGSECTKDGMINFGTNSDSFKVHMNNKEGWVQIRRR